MKLNVFKIPKDKVRDLRDKFRSLGLKPINSSTIGKYSADFFFSSSPSPVKIPWAETYSDFFKEDKPENKIYFACYLWEDDKNCFALSYGKSHFYLRQFCDHDYGTYIAKRIANPNDVKQKSSKKFAGRKKKEIKSYTKNSRLDIESGESVDYLQASIVEDQKIIFGKSGKFGSSVLLNPDIEKDKIGEILDYLSALSAKEEQFALPRTIIIDNTLKSQKFEEKLVDEILSSTNNTDFSSNAHDLFGVDFVFSGQEKYKFIWRGHESDSMDTLSIESLAEFVQKLSIPKNEVLAIKIEIEKEEHSKTFYQYVKDSLDYIVSDENVILSQGRWMEFNKDYVEQLDEYIDAIDLEPTEDSHLDIKSQIESDFNASLVALGYENADKNFSKIKTASGVLIEAWDLKKDDTVYAVKFGTPQKLGYVFDQSVNTLEIINKKANIKKLNVTFKNYCVWIVIDRSEKIKSLSEIKSIIFKQKLEYWARKCSDFNITPKVKISYLKKE